MAAVVGLSACTLEKFEDEEEKESGVSPYIDKVWEYHPAPGQFINTGYSGVTIENPHPTYEQILETLTKGFKGKANGSLVTLGGFGGYIVVGFDHMVVNSRGDYDFKVYGNAFWGWEAKNPNGGSCEPGIIEVMHDANGNGLPDDEWYEIAGSDYSHPETVHGYEITYFRPGSGQPDTIRWVDNQGQTGCIDYLPEYHTQMYYPEWYTGEIADSVTFRGTKVRNTAIEESGKGTYWVLYALDWGYVDNYPNELEQSNIKISWAVDKEGNPVDLPGIHFVRVYTGQNQKCGWLGETSTELGGMEDLHPRMTAE